MYWIANTGVFLLARVLFRLKVTGKEMIPKQGGVLIACNHVSYLDPPLVHSSVPRRMVHSMAKKRLFKHPFLNWFMTTVGTICVDDVRFRKTLTEAVLALADGDCVVVFPEGTRSGDGILKKGGWGTVSIAIRSNCTIVPAAITGSEKAFPREGKGIKFVPIKIRFGKPYTIPLPINLSREKVIEETVRLMEKIEALLPEDMRPCEGHKKEWYKTDS